MQSNNLGAPTLKVRGAIQKISPPSSDYNNNLCVPTLNFRHAIDQINTSVHRLWMFEALYQKQAYISTLSTSAIRFWMFGPLKWHHTGCLKNTISTLSSSAFRLWLFGALSSNPNLNLNGVIHTRIIFRYKFWYVRVHKTRHTDWILSSRQFSLIGPPLRAIIGCAAR